MILKKSKKQRVEDKLKSFGFYEQQVAHIFKNHEFSRIVDVVNYYGWLIKHGPNREYTNHYFYFILNNFDFNKTYPEYRDYYRRKKNTSSLDLGPKKTYTLKGEKVGEDYKSPNEGPKNVLDFIKDYGEKDNKNESE